MNFSLQDVPLPLRFRTEVPMTDEELMQFPLLDSSLQWRESGSDPDQ